MNRSVLLIKCFAQLITVIQLSSQPKFTQCRRSMREFPPCSKQCALYPVAFCSDYTVVALLNVSSCKTFLPLLPAAKSSGQWSFSSSSFSKILTKQGWLEHPKAWQHMLLRSLILILRSDLTLVSLDSVRSCFTQSLTNNLAAYMISIVSPFLKRPEQLWI